MSTTQSGMFRNNKRKRQSKNTSYRKPKARVAGRPVTTTQVRKTLLQLAETKRFFVNPGISGVLGTGTFYGYNPLYWIQNGSSDVQRIGDEFFFDTLDLKMTFVTARVGYSSHTGTGDPLNVWVSVLKSTEVNHDGTLGPSSTGFAYPDFRHGGVGSVSNPLIDTHKVTVIWNRSFQIKANVVSPSPSFPDNQIYDLTERVPIKKSCKFQALLGGYLKDYNYYVVWGYTNPTSYSNLTVNVAYQVNFKDI